MGKILAGRYEVVKKLGAGSMGRVYLCRDRVLEKSVAVKEIPESDRERARREFQILRSIDHPSIAKALDYIEDEESGAAFMAQEYIDGADILEASKSAGYRAVAEWGMKIASALHFIHGRGIAHGDVKPENAIVPRDKKDNVVLVDFGLASLDLETETRGGTPAYMAPEVLSGAAVSPVSDIYSLGALLYHCLASRPPFDAEDISTLLHSMVHERPDPIREVNSEIPTTLADIVDAMVETDPATRRQSARRAAAELAKFAGCPPPSDERFVGRLPMLGRNAELEGVKDRIEAMKNGVAVTPLIMHGPKGIGASRLMEAAMDRARTMGVRVLHIPLLHGRHAVDILRDMLPTIGIDTDTSRGDSLSDEENAPLRARRTVAAALRKTAEEGPAVVFFDDLEDAPESSVELFRFLALEFSKECDDGPSPMIAAACSGSLPDRLAEDIFAGWIESIEPGPLSEETVAKVVEESWDAPPSERALAAIFEMSGGNPLWLIEILRVVTDETLVEEAEAPESISGLMRSAISGLPLSGIKLLEAMSVMGEPATAEEISSIVGADLERVLDDLAGLVGRDLITASSGMFSPAGTLVAGHVKEDLAVSVLRDLSSKAAAVLLARPSASPESVARLLIDAGRLEEAIEYVDRAGEELRARGSHREAALLFEEALEKVQPEDNVRKTMLEGLARSAAPAGLWRHALKALRERLEIAHGDTPSTRARFHLEMAHCQQRIGEYDRARRAVDRAVAEVDEKDSNEPAIRKAGEIAILLDIAVGKYGEAVEKTEKFIIDLDGEPHEAAPFRTARGIGLVYTGKMKDAVTDFETAIESYKDADDPQGAVMALTGLGMARQHGEELEAALDAYREALETSRKAGDLRAESTASMNIATIHQARNEWDTAEHYYNRALMLARQVGAGADEVRILGNLGNLLIYLGEPEAALPLIELSLRGSNRLGLEAYRAYAHLLRGDILKSRGEMMGARREYVRARRRFDKLGSAREIAQTDLRLARLYLQMGEAVRARDTILIAMRAAIDLGLKSFHAESAMLEARRQLIWGRPEEAELRAREAVEMFERAGEANMWESRAVLGAALVSTRKTREAREQLDTAYEAAVELRNGVPERNRDTFLTGTVWKDLVANIELARADSDSVPQERWKKLIDINRRLTTEHDLARLLELIMDSVLELIEAERGFLILLQDGKVNVPVARNIDRESVRGAKMKISRSIAEEVSRTGEPLITVDAQQDSRFDRYASVHDLKLRSVLCIPLKIRDKVIGTLYVDNRFREGAFREDDLTVMEAFADQAAIAIDNARRKEDIELSHRKIKTLAAQLEQRVDRQNVEIEKMRIELADRDSTGYESRYPEIVGASESMRLVFDVMERVTPIDVPVLIEGESGTGKELVARAIHFQGPREKKRFLSENCSAIPETLLESELFGYEKGAFTGASDRKTGLFEMADGGTLFLDEIGDMSPGMQAKLLRVLQEGEVRRVGGEKTFNVNVRIISATHQNLEQLVKKGLFREDLFWRLNVVRIVIPPIRERMEDIPMLVEHFSKLFAGEFDGGIKVDNAAMRLLTAYEWPGNVREIENEIRKAAVLGDGKIGVPDLSPRIVETVQKRGLSMALHPSGKLKQVVEEFEREYLERVLAECDGNRAEAARRLGIGRRTLYDKLERYKIE